MNESRSALLPSLLMLALSSAALHAQGFTPEESLKRMKVADGFAVQLVASEPAIRQPLTMTFDDRGRLWVIQYLQYPNPAGLKPVKVDQYLRTVYDRMTGAAAERAARRRSHHHPRRPRRQRTLSQELRISLPA